MLALVAGLLPAGRCGADAPELITDRPDRTESTSIVTPGRWQVEAGYTHAAEAGAGGIVSSDAAPQALLRAGILADRLELRIAHDGWEFSRTARGAGTSSGAGDAAVGMKFGLLAERGPAPDVSVLAQSSVPMGSPALSSGRFDPEVLVLLGHSLPRDWSIAANVGAAWEPTTTAAVYSLSLGVPLANRWGAYLEVYGEAPGGKVTGAVLNGGITLLARQNLQLDAEGGCGLAGDAGDWYAGLGVSFRYPD